MTSCETIREALVAWLDGELDAAQGAGVRSHLDGCGACVAELASYRATQAAIRSVLSGRAGGARRLGRDFDALWQQASGDPAVRDAVLPSSRSEAARRGGGAHRSAGAFGRRVSVWGSALAAGVAAIVFAYGSGWLMRSPTPGQGSGGSIFAQSSAGHGGGDARVAHDTSRGARGNAGGASGNGAVVPVGARSDDGKSEQGEGRAAEKGESGDLPVPDELRQRPGFFLDYPIVHRLEKLRRLEATNAVPDAGTSQGDAG